MAYVRWRPRMVRQSVRDDLVRTLKDARWIATDGATPIPAMALLTTPLTVVDAFPEAGASQGSSPVVNSLALDNGTPGEQVEAELGGMEERPYQFGMMFYAESDAVGLAVMSDLADRYLGMSDSPFISLYNYAVTPKELVTRMEVESFNYARAPEEVAPYEQHLFFCELILTDYINPTASTSTADIDGGTASSTSTTDVNGGTA